MPGHDLVEQLLEQRSKLKGRRSPEESLWNNISQHIISREASFIEQISPGVERNRHVLDSTGARSLELFGSFVHTLMNNPALQWFRVELEDEDETPTDRTWLDAVQKKMLRRMVNAGVYDHLHKIYLNLGAYGTGVMMTTAALDRSLRIRQFHLGSCVLATGEDGKVDTCHRTEMLTPRQVAQKFPAGVDLGRSVEQLLENDPHTPIEFVHSVFPVTDEVAELLPSKVRDVDVEFASVWMNAKDRQLVQVGAFEEFPYQIPRWYILDNEIYGRAPAMTVMADIRMVNRMSETILRGAEKIVDPPLILPDGGLVSPIRMFAGGISFSDGEVKPHPLMAPGASRIELGIELLKMKQEGIREGFFVPLFATPDSPVKTATQVLQEADERNRAISPMLVRLQDELLQPLVLRVFNIMSRNGDLPDAPATLQGRKIKVSYTSPLLSAQREQEAASLFRLFEQLAPWAQINPEIFDNYDPDKVSNIIDGGLGIPAVVRREPRRVQEIRTARAEAQQRVNEQQTALAGAEAGAKLQTSAAAQTRAERS